MGSLRSGSRNGRSMHLGGAGFDLMAAVLGGVLLGIWVDKKFATEPWGVVVLSLIGVIGGLVNFIRAGKRAMERASRDDRESEHE